jgi:SAM-dependent methyltransferase
VSSSDLSSTFDQHAGVYELLVDWPRRLANEEPFYRRMFDEVGAQQVLDVACGTGHHAAMFHSWGLKVQGADISPGMIARCRARFGEPPGLQWLVRPFDQPAGAEGQFDAVICVGNSLALADDLDTVNRVVGSMLDSLRTGGVCIISVLNLWSLPQGGTIWQKCKRVQYDGADHVLLKSIHRCGDRGHVSFADLELSGSEVSPRYDSAEFLGL